MYALLRKDVNGNSTIHCEYRRGSYVLGPEPVVFSSLAEATKRARELSRESLPGTEFIVLSPQVGYKVPAGEPIARSY